MKSKREKQPRAQRACSSTPSVPCLPRRNTRITSHRLYPQSASLGSIVAYPRIAFFRQTDPYMARTAIAESQAILPQLSDSTNNHLRRVYLEIMCRKSPGKQRSSRCFLDLLLVCAIYLWRPVADDAALHYPAALSPSRTSHAFVTDHFQSSPFSF